MQITETERKCSRCHTVKPIDCFYKAAGQRAGRRPDCRMCVIAYNRQWAIDNPQSKEFKRAWRLHNPEAYARQTRKDNLGRYGLSFDDYEALLVRQDHRCAICNIHEDECDRKLAIDHDHRCCDSARSCGKCVRGLVCDPCNKILGFSRDSVRRLTAAIDYLTRWQL